MYYIITGSKNIRNWRINNQLHYHGGDITKQNVITRRHSHKKI